MDYQNKVNGVKDKISRRNFLGTMAKFGLVLGATHLTGNLLSKRGVYAAGKELEIKWYGHSFFSLTTSVGTRVIIDPFGNMGYSMPQDVGGDVLTISHEHFDHNNVAVVKGSPIVLRGLKEGGRDWNEIDRRIKDVRLYTIPTYHDKSQGSKRGKNVIFVYELDNLRLAHLGDLGHLLNDEQLRKLGAIDLLFIPVGGFYTIDGIDATKVVDQVKPSWIIPMHYKTEVLPNWPGSDESVFLRGKGDVEKLEANTVKISKDDLARNRGISLMSYEEGTPSKPDDKMDGATDSEAQSDDKTKAASAGK